MSEVCPNVATEPILQPVTNERFFHCSANTETGAHLDVRARGLWGSRLILMFVCLILWLLQIINLLSLHVFNLMIVKNVKLMNNVWVM